MFISNRCVISIYPLEHVNMTALQMVKHNSLSWNLFNVSCALTERLLP